MSDVEFDEPLYTNLSKNHEKTYDIAPTGIIGWGIKHHFFKNSNQAKLILILTLIISIIGILFFNFYNPFIPSRKLPEGTKPLTRDQV